MMVALLQYRGIGADDLMARLTELVTPAAAPGAVTETLRPDLSGGTADPAPDYVPDYAASLPAMAQRLDLTFDGVARHVWLLAPPPAGPLPVPAVVLLHGSGRDGAAMIDMWQGVAAHGALLIAPDAMDPQVWNPQTDSPQFLAAVLAMVQATHPYDAAQVYLYGHSGGARYALYLATCTAGPWAAVAVHAGTLPDCAPRRAQAHVPVLLQIGDADALFPLADVRQTAATLARAGHAVVLHVIPRHGHWFYDVGPGLAADAWVFFTQPPPA